MTEHNVEKAIRTKVEQRVRFVPITPYAIRFWRDETTPHVYPGRPSDGGGPALPATPEGFVADGFATSNYLAWVEERTIYEVDSDPWEVAGPSSFPPGGES